MAPLARRVLDVIFVVALISLLAVGRLEREYFDPRLIFSLVVVAVATWLVLRRREVTWLLVVFWLIAYATLLLKEPMLLMVAVLLVFVRYGVRLGLRSVAIALGPIEIGWVLRHLIIDDPSLVETVHGMVSTIGHLGVPVVLGVALSRLQVSVADLAAANAELRDANEELADQALLAQDLMLAEERSRAARELHGSLGNQLTAAAMSIDYASRVASDDSSRAVAELAQARGVVGEALGDLRIWVRAMNPANRAARFGLDGLNEVAASFRGTGLAVEVQVPDDHPPLGQRVELYVVRFVQEGLTNALRHGRASRVWVSATVGSGVLQLQLQDDGLGATGVPFEGFGLRTLRERAAGLGGDFSASAAPEGGFRIRASLPLAPEPAELEVVG